MRTSLKLFLAVASLTPALVMAEPPTSQPAEPRRPVREMMNELRGARGDRPDRADRGDRPDRPDRQDRAEGEHPEPAADEVSPEEWGQIEKLMQEIAPNRWKFYLEIKDTRRSAELIRERIVERYRWLKKIEPNAKLYETAIAQAKAEDEVWGAMRAAQKDDTPENQAILRTKVRASVERNLSDREERLARLRDSLAREEEQLKADRQNIDQLVEKQIDRLTQENPFRPPPQGPWGQPGMGRREGRPPGDRQPGDRPNRPPSDADQP